MDQGRRQFLRTTAAGSIGSLALTNQAIAAVRRQPMPAVPAPAGPRGAEPVRIGVIGTGGMGTGHVESLLAIGKDGRANVQVAALADVCRPRLEAARAKVVAAQGEGTVEVHYPDYGALLARPDIHGVLIASPEHWHARMVEDAVAAGKAVYVEKPMTLRMPEALRLHELTQANPQALVVVGTQFVVSPGYRKARELVAAGSIGKPVWSQTSYCRNSKEGEWLYYAIDPAWEPGVNLDWKLWCGPLGDAPWNAEVYARWRRYRKYSTGIIGDLLVHRITPIIMALDLGWPTRVVASGGHYVDTAMENHDQVNLNIEFEGNHTLVVAGSTVNEVGLETVIRGHKGNLYLTGRTVTLRPERLYADEVDEQTITGDDQGDDQDRLRIQWIEAIRSKAPSPSPVELGAKVMVAVDLATRSLWEGSAFGFDPKTMRARKL
ncbi:MAG: Gfo/Idh/MocA family oxidoreductase [Gemmatimonadales bacterium]|nr:Gfo/Idh/MocA family oxidoreductase [Gemmatimonadales bacterium]